MKLYNWGYFKNYIQFMKSVLYGNFYVIGDKNDSINI